MPVETDDFSLPAPRLQFRWKEHAHESGANWMCFYELVLRLGESDIRRKRNKKSELALTIGRTRVTRSTYPLQDGVPFRDGAHCSWDNAQLGNLPVFVVVGNEWKRVNSRAVLQPLDGVLPTGE